MLARIARWQLDQGAAAAARAVSALALAALAVIHVVDLPGSAPGRRGSMPRAWPRSPGPAVRRAAQYSQSG